MKDWRNVAIPERMKALPRDRRGFPVPHIVLRDAQGVPRFQINNDTVVEACIAGGLCTICGQSMPADDQWLVGGPLSAFHPQGMYIDAPTHYDCLHYALQVCPYLAVSKYMRRLDPRTVNPQDLPEHVLFADPTQSDERVPFFVAVQVRGYTVLRPRLGQRYLRPLRPYVDVQYWNDGQRLTQAYALKLLRDHEVFH
ncbi:hypothetical protein [Spirosoma sordidisoli]|uniref:Uncharacterized protein n=1 Tax=Spirosoma sordidisoli TaxID=2502893 RepID=A0A4Q2UHV0_9BACT|nr:hypothetical protein [Spirosoma sordidisoli]RYC66309.1 hypothetical protein EQG79_29995 [Spirosoma sordidisoli]